jgi:hypothetical protein
MYASPFLGVYGANCLIAAVVFDVAICLLLVCRQPTRRQLRGEKINRNFNQKPGVGATEKKLDRAEASQ